MPIPGKTFQTSYSLAKPNSQTAKTRNSEIYSALRRETMKTSQNVLKMSIMSPNTSTDWDNNDTGWSLQQQSNVQAFSIWPTVSVSVLQDVIKIKRLRLHWKRNCHWRRLKGDNGGRSPKNLGCGGRRCLYPPIFRKYHYKFHCFCQLRFATEP